MTQVLREMLYAEWNHIIDCEILLRFGYAAVLLVAFPKIHKKSKRHQPKLLLRKMKLADAVIEKPGKQLFVIYSAAAFFKSGSLSTFRFVPRYMASIMASLYPVSSIGDVRSSTSSAVSSAFFSSGCFRL